MAPMKRGTARAVIILVAVGLAGCSLESVLSRSAASPEGVEARAVVDALARGDLDALTPRLDDTLKTPSLPDKLRQMAAFFPKTAPTRVRVVGFNQNTVDVVGGAKTETTMIDFESNYPDANVISQVVFQRVDGGARRAVGLHANPLPVPLEVMNALTLRGKGPLHYVFVLVMLAVAAVTLAAVVVWARDRRVVRRRWWWLLAILVGAFKITLNWTTGGIFVQALTIQFLSLAFGQAGLGAPFELSLSIPAGAIAFLIVRRQARAKPAEPAAGPPPVAGPPPAAP
jgi:hypothetical protein